MPKKVLAVKFLTLCLCTLVLLFAGGGHAQPLSEDPEPENIFAPMLRESMKKSDMVAAVEVVGFQFEKRNGSSTLYRIESKILESFKGPFLQALVFYQWTDEDINAEDSNDDVTGSRIIVTLRKNEQDGRYYVPESGSSFPESEDLRDIARKIEGENTQE